MTLVDLVPRCIAACQNRFGHLQHLRYFVNDGRSLEMIDDDSVDFVFSFDSLVHADAPTMRGYMRELGRKLRVGGAGFIHHSNLGNYRGWLTTRQLVVKVCRGRRALGRLLIDDCMRAPDMTAGLMRDFCHEAGLACTVQEVIPWGRSHRPVDCLTSFERRADATEARDGLAFVNRDFMREAAMIKRLDAVYGDATGSPNALGSPVRRETTAP